MKTQDCKVCGCVVGNCFCDAAREGRPFVKGDRVTTPDGNGVVLMPETPGWDRLTILVADHKTLPYQRDYYAAQLVRR